VLTSVGGVVRKYWSVDAGERWKIAPGTLTAPVPSLY
jgi:hypothetical protein